MGDYPIAAKQWSVPDTSILSLCQLSVMEPDDLGATWPSAIWSKDEVVSYVNDIQRDFLSRTGITVAIDFFITTANIPRYDLPANTIDLRRIAWRIGPSGTAYVELARADEWELDYGHAAWESQMAPNYAPVMYMTDLTPSQTVQLQPPPGDVGEAEITFSTLGAQVDGSGILMSVPDDWTPYLAWGVLAKMLSKEGEGQDPERADYCRMRYEEGIALAQILVEGTV